MKKHFIFLLLAAMVIACGKEDPKNATPPEGAVNLGLSVFWATCNIGANDPGEYGDFFAWGELEPKTEYTWENYKFRKEGNTDQTLVVTKYNSIESHGAIDSKTVLDPEDDLATVRLGGGWHTPTQAEWTALETHCTFVGTTLDGVIGIEVTSKLNGNTLFFPAGGRHYGSESNWWNSGWGYEKMARLWASEVGTSNPNLATNIDLNITGTVYRNDAPYRYEGHNVRAVTE